MRVFARLFQAKAFALLSTLASASGAGFTGELEKFAFFGKWGALGDAKKLAHYSDFACHELNAFVYFKDRGLFDAVVRPYLANKKEKQFLDHWPAEMHAETLFSDRNALLCTATARILIPR